MRKSNLIIEQSGHWADALCLFVTLFVTFFFNCSFAQTYLPASSFSGQSAMFEKQVKSKQLRLKHRVPKMETSLSELFVNRSQISDMTPQHFKKIEKYLVNNSVRVVIIVENESFLQIIKDAAESIGGEAVAEFQTRLEVIIPINELKSLSELEGVIYIRRPRPVHPMDSSLSTSQLSTGTVVTQGVKASNANLWHDYNITGVGVKVAIIDFFKNYQTAQANGNLPATITKYGDIDTYSRHGTAVAEIIYDMAPGASMIISSVNSITQMASYIVGLAQSGNDIISSSVFYYNDEPGDGSGTVSSAINTATNTHGTLYVQCAGNDAQRHYDGSFIQADSISSDWWDHHHFAPNVVFNQLGYLPAGFTVQLFLRWNDWPATDQDYDMNLIYWDGEDWVGEWLSDDVQDGTQPPTEEIIHEITVGGLYGFWIHKWSATGDNILDIHAPNVPSMQFYNSDRSLVDPATADTSFSVAAVDVSTFNLENYSAWGPTHGPGGALIGGDKKPRIAAFANVDTWAYGPGNFNGTSSAAPHVAGAAALVCQAYPNYSPVQVAQFLENRASDNGESGYDYQYGHGCLNLGYPSGAKPPSPWSMFLPAIIHGHGQDN